MTFLKKFGTVLLRIVGVVAGIAPIVEQSLPQSTPIIDKLTQIGNMVLIAEGMFAGTATATTGADKLKAVTPFVAQIIQASELVAGKKIKNEVLFTSACTGIASNVADLLNSLEN